MDILAVSGMDTSFATKTCYALPDAHAPHPAPSPRPDPDDHNPIFDKFDFDNAIDGNVDGAVAGPLP